MKALAWSHIHLPHRHHAPGESTREHPHDRRRALLAGVLAAYLALLAVLVTAGRAAFGMDGAEAWGFGIGVASYVLLFGAFIGGLAWAVSNNLADDPSRR